MKAQETLSSWKVRWFAISLVLAVLVVWTKVEQEVAGTLRQEIAGLRAQTSELDTLRAENERLKLLQANAQEWERLGRENRELLKLRGEVAALRRELSALRQAKAAALAESAEVLARFNCTTNNGALTLTEYTGPAGEVTIPGTIEGLPVTVIGEMAFVNCSNVTSVTLPDSVTNIAAMAFGGCSLTNVMLGNGVTSIGVGAFSCSGLASVTIPESVERIEGQAFSHCPNLTAVFFKGNAPQVHPTVFNNDSLATVYYVRDTKGWGPTYGGRPAVLLNP